MKKFIDIHVPITACNLRCHYCYVTQMCKSNTEKVEFKYSPQHVGKALSAKRLGGKCLINICGLGETLIPKELIAFIKVLLDQGHYVMIVTNGVLSERFNEIAELSPKLLSRLMFKFSFHFLELKRLSILDVFFKNVEKMRQAGCSFTVEITPTDELEPYIDDIREICMSRLGALCHVTIPRKENHKAIPLLSSHTIDEFYKVWSVFDSELLNFKYSIWGVKRKEFCHAGEWTALLDLGTGLMTPCYNIRGQKQNIFQDVDKPIIFYPVGSGCKMPHCYNGHAFLALGDIPSINTLHYGKLRDRVDTQGRHWLNEDMREFLNERLEYNNDDEYTICQRLGFNYKKYYLLMENIFEKAIKR